MPEISVNNDSILTSVKKLLGLGEDDTDFDADIIMHINSVFSNLVQMGVGPEEGFVISDKTSVWSDFIGDSKKLQQVRPYVYTKVRLLFDPPTNSSLLDSMKQIASELEWRMYVEKGGY